MLTHLIEFVYRLLWGDLFTLPVGGGIGISLMVVLLFTAGIWFTLRTRLLPVRLFRDMIAAVCEKNQNKEGLSSFQTLVVSTASPFKFCSSVLPALGVTQLAQGTGILDQLTQVTGVEAPAPLAGLKDRKVRFQIVTEKEHMVDQVLEMLR